MTGQTIKRCMNTAFPPTPPGPVPSRGQALTQASVSGGVSPTVPLIAGAGFCYPAAETERLTTRICLDEPLRAPGLRRKNCGGGGVLPERNRDWPGAAGGRTDSDAQGVLRIGRTEIGIKG